MAKRRTRSQKVAAKHTYSYSLKSTSHSAPVSRPPTPLSQASPSGAISIQFPKLIAFDLVKTVIISGLIITIQLSLYIFWH